MSQEVYFLIAFLFLGEVFHCMGSISFDAYAKYKNKKLYILGHFRYIFFRCLRNKKYIKGKGEVTSKIVKEYCNSIGKVSFWYQIANWIYLFIMVILLLILPSNFEFKLVLVSIAYFILNFLIALIVNFMVIGTLKSVYPNEE